MGEGKDGGDNGAASPPTALTQEEITIKRQKLWSDNPDEFIHISELVIGTRVLPSGQLQCVVGMPNQLLLEMSGTRITYEINKILMALETKARREAQPSIIPAKGGIMNFVRRK